LFLTIPLIPLLVNYLAHTHIQQWRHFFLKRNYALASSDQECVHRDYKPESMQNCHSTCFIFSLNGTNRETGLTRTLGVGRGCSSHFLTDDQHMHLGLGTHTKPSEVGTYLPADFDKLEIYEHWCFCATDYCNTQVCYSRPFGSSEFPGSYIGKRLQYSSYSSDWRFRNSCDQAMPSSLLLLLLLSTVLV
ncbi:hypothetical protein ANCDUO_12543, partial [Ancylostoma duodenale]